MAVIPGANLTTMDAAPRGDEVHAPLTVNPYDKPQFDPQQAVDYENGYQYAQSFGHQQLNQASEDEVLRWSHAPIPWREGFAEAAKRLGVGRLADMLLANMKQAELVPWDYTKCAGLGKTMADVAVKSAPIWGGAAGFGLGHYVGDAIGDEVVAGTPYDPANIEGEGLLQDFARQYTDNRGAVAGGTFGGFAGQIAGTGVQEYRRAKRMQAQPLPSTLKLGGALKTVAGGVLGTLAPIAIDSAIGYEVGDLVNPEGGIPGAVLGAAAGATYAPYTGMAGAMAGAMHDRTKEKDTMRKRENLLAHGIPYKGAAAKSVKLAISAHTANLTISGGLAGAALPILAGAGLGAGFGELVDADTPGSYDGTTVGGIAGGAAGATLSPVGAIVGSARGASKGLQRDAKVERENQQWARLYPQGA